MEHFKFSSLEYKRPDFEAIGAFAEELTEKCRNILLAVLQDLTLGKTPDLMLGYSGKEDVQGMKALLAEWSAAYGENGRKKTDHGTAAGDHGGLSEGSGR